MGGGGGKTVLCYNGSIRRCLAKAIVHLWLKFGHEFISHSSLKIEREISHTLQLQNFPHAVEVRNFPQNIPTAKSPRVPPFLSHDGGLPNIEDHLWVSPSEARQDLTLGFFTAFSPLSLVNLL